MNAEVLLPDVCWYCDGDGTDHRHGSGRSCGGCCAIHGGILHDDKHAYDWVEACLKAKNARIARLEQELSAAKAAHGETLLLLNKAAFETIPKLEQEAAALRAEKVVLALELANYKVKPIIEKDA